MYKKAIGFKVEYSMPVILLMILGGLAFIMGGILLYIFVIQGAIGGGIAGGLIGAGIYSITYTIASKKLPFELIHIDEKAVYTPKSVIDFVQIQDVISKGKSIVIIPKEGKKITQICIKNSSECGQMILNAIQAQNTLSE